ncbi:MAG TPA: response regulator transcription factor [Ktedonobacterales bacterium]|nr:response regulator transcription factor [Ktedonobacterales bacterium]
MNTKPADQEDSSLPGERTHGGQAAPGPGRGSSARILVIDDEPEIWRAVRAGMTSVGFAAEWAATGAEGIDLVARWHPDVIILDLTLPDLDGIEVCRRLRSWSQVPIIVLSVREGDADKVTALELGADDYLTKPFSIAELVARVRVALRHAAQRSGSSDREARFQTGGLVIDFERRQVSVDGREIHVTPIEYDLLKYLAYNAGRVLTHRAILRAVWGPAYENEIHYLRVFFNQLRRKIEPVPGRPRYLLTELGIGYRLRSPD